MKRSDNEYNFGDKVLLIVSSWIGIMRLKKKKESLVQDIYDELIIIK